MSQSNLHTLPILICVSHRPECQHLPLDGVSMVMNRGASVSLWGSSEHLAVPSPECQHLPKYNQVVGLERH